MQVVCQNTEPQHHPHEVAYWFIHIFPKSSMTKCEFSMTIYRHKYQILCWLNIALMQNSQHTSKKTTLDDATRGNHSFVGFLGWTGSENERLYYWRMNTAIQTDCTLMYALHCAINYCQMHLTHTAAEIHSLSSPSCNKLPVTVYYKTKLTHPMLKTSPRVITVLRTST